MKICSYLHIYKNTMTYKSLIFDCIKKIIDWINSQEKTITNRDLLRICEPLGHVKGGEINPHLPHEVAEMALNFLIKEKYAAKLLADKNPQKSVEEILKPLTYRLPTQNWRSLEQINYQQFSTPPSIAYLLAHLLEIKIGDHVLEPSAGTGNLAIWAKAIGAKISTNEIDEKRAKLLKYLDFEPTAFNAEYINDFLPPEILPNCVMMNPPFSSNGGRTNNNSSKFGFRHVESALERLKKGGKFGIILGEAGGLDTKTGNELWRKLSDRIEVKSIIKIDGREYYKNGTKIDINLITGYKLLETRKIDWNYSLNQINCLTVNTVEEAFEKVNKFHLRLKQ